MIDLHNFLFALTFACRVFFDFPPFPILTSPITMLLLRQGLMRLDTELLEPLVEALLHFSVQCIRLLVRHKAVWRDNIDRERGRRRHWATFSARVEIPTILGPERGLEMLTAVQWRQKLGLMDFRSDRASFARGCCQAK